MSKRTGKGPFILVTGGCRSGKSAFAQRLAEALGPDRLFLASAQIYDEEMRRRTLAHRRKRGAGWRLYELGADEAAGLPGRLGEIARPGEVLLFDCLTLWAAACMRADRAPPGFAGLCGKLAAALASLPCPVLAVQNETGSGVVPLTPAGRAFRDMSGIVGQCAAARADCVVFMVCGLPLILKGQLPLSP
ncbi:MAG: bifunctional adenosylcobinamide kinase/adenosylcobinamide-phosphate guanylyltransferase [Desulfovibrio sp.]|jgi:adenosylcobinamide kinase/adenosylcobinamide-phosphate guanylyltransferase|nr:bifunctional adenosylcobinamide kinase/adenosylcobinamide-phosphate guanylyltransferase [Desulfovibrio sp.]